MQQEAVENDRDRTTTTMRRRFLRAAGSTAALGPLAGMAAGDDSDAAEPDTEKLEGVIGHLEDLSTLAPTALLVDFRRDGTRALRSEVESIDLHRGIERSLVAKLNVAERSNDRAGDAVVDGDVDRAEDAVLATNDQLQSFVDQLDDLAGKKVTQEASDELIVNARRLIDAQTSVLGPSNDIQNPLTVPAHLDAIEAVHADLVKEVRRLRDSGHEVELVLDGDDPEIVVSSVTVTVAVTGTFVTMMMALTIWSSVQASLPAIKMTALHASQLATTLVRDLVTVRDLLALLSKSARLWLTSSTSRFVLLARAADDADDLAHLVEELIELLDSIDDARELKEVLEEVARIGHEVLGWPQLQFDPANTGRSPAAVGPTGEVQPAWTFYAGDAIRSPVVARGTVYVGSADHDVYALRADDGTELWSADVGHDARGVAVVDGVVYVGTGGVDALVALDAEDGSEVWRYTDSNGKGKLRGSPTVVDDVIYAGGLDDNVFAVDAETGEELWRRYTGECFGGQSPTPAVADGTVYVSEDCGDVLALAAADGSVKWRYDTGTRRGAGSPPAIVDGVVYVGSLTAPGGRSVQKVYAIDAETGQKLWDFPVGDDVRSSPAVADGTVYVGSSDQNVYAIDATDGTEQWSFSTVGDVSSSPAVANGTVYVGSHDGLFYLLDAETGDKVDAIPIGTGSVTASPAVFGGRVYVGNRNGAFFAVDEA